MVKGLDRRLSSRIYLFALMILMITGTPLLLVLEQRTAAHPGLPSLISTTSPYRNVSCIIYPYRTPHLSLNLL